MHANVARYGGDPDTIVLAGHSAGGQLAARVALDPAPLAALGVDRRVVKGVVSVSGAGLDLTDDESWRLGQPRGYYETALPERRRHRRLDARRHRPRASSAPTRRPALVI